MTSAFRPPELMSPAGYWPQLRAAIEAGADAVYFGLQHFTARAKTGFGLEELPEAVRTLHGRGVKAFVTFNTLVFDHELEQAEATIAAIARSGADAIIVQDCGAARLARAVAPGLEIHGSTQMSITSAEGAELARSFGVSRVVLARELSLADIGRIRQQTDMELEVFVHGALCVSYSGQCFSSEAWGGRSANRGQCAQACRLSWDLIVDGARRELGEKRYLLSPGDLCTIDQIPELVRLGISCLKIEGRYKDEGYVAVTTASYRAAIDAAVRGQAFRLPEEERRDLEQVYSRGLGPWFLGGTNHQLVVEGRAPRHRGLLAGKVREVRGQSVIVAGDLPLSRGDGLVFDAADRRSPDLPEEGGFLYDVRELAEGVRELRFGEGCVRFENIASGDWVWRTLDPTLRKRLRQWTEPSDPVRTLPVAAVLTARVGEPLALELQLLSRDPQQLQTSAGGQTLAAATMLAVTVRDESPVQAATRSATPDERIREQLGRMGGTPFHLERCEIDRAGEPFLPSSQLNDLRRSAVEKLRAAMEEVPERTTRKALAEMLPVPVDGLRAPRNETVGQLHLLVRTPEQLEGALAVRPHSITLDYLELYGLRTSVDRIREAGIPARVASPRILKPSEQKVVRFLESLGCPILVRSGGLLYGLLQIAAEERPQLHGDFSLNIANVLSARALMEMGLRRWTPTHDLNAEQLCDLARALPAAEMEVVVFQHLPVFHTEHCVFCRFLTEGTDNTNCGHPCETHRIALRDASGRSHPVMADVGCRNTVFNAEIQTATKYLDRIRNAGVAHYRMEFVHQSADEVARAAGAMAGWINGQLTAEAIETTFRACGPSGTTEGSLFVPSGFRQLVSLTGHRG